MAPSLMSLIQVSVELADSAIPFSVHYAADRCIVTISAQLNTTQLATIVNLGFSMGPDKVFMVMCSSIEEGDPDEDE